MLRLLEMGGKEKRKQLGKKRRLKEEFVLCLEEKSKFFWQLK